MFAKRAKYLRDFASIHCPFHAAARSRFGRKSQISMSIRAASIVVAPGSGPRQTESIPVPALSPTQHFLLASHYMHIKEVFSIHRPTLTTGDLAVAWVRLAKISKDPAERLSPELQKFVDILACASIDNMHQFTPSHLCSIIWAASKLKKGIAQSGMFKSFIKSWAAAVEPHIDGLELEQLRKCMAGITRVGFIPGPSWKHQVEEALSRQLMTCACAKTLACCLVSAASLGFALHPSAAFRQAIGSACVACLAAPQLQGTPDVARFACSALWAAAVLSVPLGHNTIQLMLSHVTAAGTKVSPTHPTGVNSDASEASTAHDATTGAGANMGTASISSSVSSAPKSAPAALTPLDFAQVFWALSKLRYKPADSELLQLLSASSQLLHSAPPELLATILWGLADLEVVPPDAWLQLTYSSFERQLDAASAEPLQALLHAAATLQLPAPKWSGRLMERLQDVDLRTLPDGNMVDLVMSMHALAMHPPPQLAHRLQDECIRRLTQRSGSSALPPVGSGASAAASETVVDTIRRPGP